MAAGSQWDESATVVAENYPDTIFCAINGQISDFPNQIPVFPKEYEGSYLAGIIAGYTTENGQFAVTGGQSNDPMVKLMDTYEAMAIKVAEERGIEGAAATRAFVDSWTDVSATKDLLASMIDNGADTVFCYSNEGTSGAIQAAEEKGVKFVGFSADKNGESDCVVGSVSMNWAAVYPTIVENILNGSWTGKTDIGVAEGVFEVIPTDQMSEECVAAVDEAIEQIKNGHPITITDPNMTRFMMNLDEAVDLVMFAFTHGNPGDLFIQKADASTIGDLAKAVQQLFGETETKIIGSRHGEKLYETLLTKEERLRAEDMGD
jgi:basic membrane protein A